MAKKKSTNNKKTQPKTSKPKGITIPENLPADVKQKVEAIRKNLEKFHKSIHEKFDKYIVGMALLPPPLPPGKNLPPDVLVREKKRYEEEKDKHHLLILIDDSEPTKMSKFELRDKLSTIMHSTAKEIDDKFIPQTLLVSEIWQNCYDGKYDLLNLIGMSVPLYDTGMLGALRVCEVHKKMVLKRFEKYIVTYVLAGSVVKGKATPTSDVDVFLVIDDTDVKKMTRVELRDKLRAIIYGMGIEAGEITGIRNKISIQPYILTDFWDMVRESNPVIFTFLRDGVPLFDRGLFMPWKQLLRMGKIKPSTEAIDMFMSSGEQTLNRIRANMRKIATEDFYWAIHTPTQAALMLYGVPPPAPKETCSVLRELLVKKEGLLEEEYVKTLESIIKIYKDMEHGVKQEFSGKDIDKLLADCEKYMKRLKRLFTQIEKLKEEENMLAIYDNMQTILRDVLKIEGVKTAPEGELAHFFEEKLIATGKIPAKFLRTLHDLIKAKADYDAGKLTKTEVDKVRKESNELTRYLIDYIQRKRAAEFSRAKIRIKHGQKYGEITLLGNTAYIVNDISKPDMLQAKVADDGKIGTAKPCKPEEFEEALSKKQPRKITLSEPFFTSLKEMFGKDYEIVF